MHLKEALKNKNGVTVIELLIALVISALLIAALYRTFIGQQKTYIIQEQVVDMQQNVRVAINKMMREIRMAGFGGMNDNTSEGDDYNDIIKTFGNVNGFENIINPADNVTVDGIVHDQIVILTAHAQVAALENNISAGNNSFKVNFTGNTRFDQPWRKYVNIGGRHNYAIVSTNGDTLTLEGGATFNENHSAGEPVFLVRAIRYGLRMDGGKPVLFRDLYPNTGGSRRETLAENIENLRFIYRLRNETETDSPANPDIKNIRMVRVIVTARTKDEDPNYKEGDGFRRREIASYVKIRNMDIP